MASQPAVGWKGSGRDMCMWPVRNTSWFATRHGISTLERKSNNNTRHRQMILTISLMASGFFLAAIANCSGTVDPLALENSVDGVVGAGSFILCFGSEGDK
ncbi:unnamed protein product [Ectocarpus sp. 8 AP-2014]